MDAAEQKELILKSLIVELIPYKSPYGGQHVGVGARGAKVSHPDFGIEITVTEFRSVTENRNTAILLFELFLSEIIK